MLGSFLAKHRLPDAFRESAAQCFVPLGQAVARWSSAQSGTKIFGINGAQGTGKSTLADFLKTMLAAEYAQRCAVVSIDDFYLTQRQRQRLGEEVHPLLTTRGVPGTHDIALAKTVLEDLKSLQPGESYALPRFDKSIDDRAPRSSWESVEGPVDIVILEGWCVGSSPSDAASLQMPINSLERTHDQDGIWRRYVNDQLGGAYKEFFSQLDWLCFLRAPSFEAIVQWRTEQEHKLRAKVGGHASAVMSDDEVVRFIQHYQRVTEGNFRSLPDRADVLIELDNDHRATGMHWR